MTNGEALEEVRRRLAIDLEQLWVDYVGLGGSASPRSIEAYLRGERDFERGQHDALAQAINECAMERGLNHPAPYDDELRDGGER